MAGTSTTRPTARCIACGFEAPSGGDEWEAVDHPPLGTMAQCPECGSTNVTTRP